MYQTSASSFCRWAKTGKIALIGANSLLFHLHKKTPPETTIPDGNNFVPYQLARRQTSSGRTTKLNILDKVAPSAPVFAFRQKLARAKRSANPPRYPDLKPLASLPYGKQERTARFIITFTVPFLQSAPRLRP